MCRCWDHLLPVLLPCIIALKETLQVAPPLRLAHTRAPFHHLLALTNLTHRDIPSFPAETFKPTKLARGRPSFFSLSGAPLAIPPGLPLCGSSFSKRSGTWNWLVRYRPGTSI